ncbi:histone-like transcription factor family [Schizosaccharomyces japonicus yFS275]|uniref:Histone-like transcription factor family n=1 Tax=Schizosaccharomyces japonicus (strain yFS275 / FY16936) TaxID=402676 RepID=B6JZ00_SCHJY|nr:histone-like transcription factor family [Schizosaccharomyces japonicus yFS275]EEB06768.1 histone-like transcription factor family [Schizosaccharomyces japonicus yFS275]
MDNTSKGKTILPLSRVKKTIKMDKDIHSCSNASVLLISLATEMFLKRFSQKAFQITKINKRRTIQQKDLADAVRKDDQLEFLTDVIPSKM